MKHEKRGDSRQPQKASRENRDGVERQVEAENVADGVRGHHEQTAEHNAPNHPQEGPTRFLEELAHDKSAEHHGAAPQPYR